MQYFALATLDVVYQVALLPFRRSRTGGLPVESATLVARMDEYNAAAEQHALSLVDSTFLIEKPFSDPSLVPTYLFDVATLIEGMRLHPGDVVVEIGAGSCWLSHILNRFGCSTISVDVSPTMLVIGKELFERDARTNWKLEPQFIVYDGRRLPLDDDACDRVVIHDAFHHIPNQRDLLLEMHRVLRMDGVVAMSEPGLGHGTAEQSLRAASTGVLENELDLENLAALAEDCGFETVNILVATPHVHPELPARDLGAFMGGKGFARYWKEFCSALEQHHFILLHKGSPTPTTRRPGRLNARIEAPADARASIGEQASVHVRITNTGDTRWLAQASRGVGLTRLGGHLYRAAAARDVVDFDWFRASLPNDVAPGAQVAMKAVLPPILEPGTYVVVFDLVVENLTWFADRGSNPVVLTIRIT